MKRLLTLLLLFVCSLSRGQVNLVRNPSFEQYSHCPDRADVIKYAIEWSNLDSAWSPPDWAHVPWGCPDYCNSCATAGDCSLPQNLFFYQVPRSGNALAMVQMFYDESGYTDNKRDYLQGHLSSVLVAGQSYCVSFYVNLADESGYAISTIGAYFDDGTIDTTRNPGHVQTHCMPQVITATIMPDKINWVKVQGSFIANGTERLITIGNFKDKTHSGCIAVRDTTGAGISGVGFVSWYLIDDVSVIAIDATINAGADRVITGTDSVTIGDTLDTYLPTYWYANGSLIDSNTAWLRVLPDTTTMYVVELSRCGGDNITDTVWVYVGALGASPGGSNGEVKLLPNPAQGTLTICGAAHGAVTITDMVGREVLHAIIATAHEGLDISGIAPGLYMAQVVMPDGGRKCVRVVVAEP